MTDTGPAIVVGVPLPGSSGFFVVDSLHELDPHAARALSIVLTLVAAGTTAAGAGLGWYNHPPGVAADGVGDPGRAGDRRWRPALPGSIGHRTRPRAAHLVVQRHGRPARRPHGARPQVCRRRQPRTPVAAADPRRKRPASWNAAATTSTSAPPPPSASSPTSSPGSPTSSPDLLELTRADQPADRSPVDIAELARQIAGYRGTADLVTVAPGTTATWYVDRRRVAQVLAKPAGQRRHATGAAPTQVLLGGTTAYTSSK